MTSVFEVIASEVAAKRSLRESMERVIAACAANQPSGDWEVLRALPYEHLEELRDWIWRPLRLDSRPGTLAGIWFGLFHPAAEYGPYSTDMRVSGSTEFDPNPEDNSWASGSAWRPAHRRANSSILASITRIAHHENGLGHNAIYALCLAYGALAIRELLESITLRYLILGDATTVGVAVGWDSGDFILLGLITDHGLVPAA